MTNSVLFQSPVQVTLYWTAFKTLLTSKGLLWQLQSIDHGTMYTLWCLDGDCTYICYLVKAASSTSAMFESPYSKAQNDTDVAEFEASYLATSNAVMDRKIDVRSTNLKRRFGNLTSTSVSEVLVFGRTYAEPASEAQRSIKSTSASDDDGTPSGARVIRINYLTSNYVRKSEDVVTNGTAGVNTVASDIRFVESMEVIKGTEAVGAIQLMTATGGGGSEIMAISAATTQTHACHHYVEAGKKCYLRRWGATADDEVSLKLLAQDRPNGIDLVNRTVDLEKMFNGNLTPPNRLTFERDFVGGVDSAPEKIVLQEKTYVRVTVVPNQVGSTVTRAWIDFWEE